MYGCESWTVKKAEHQRIDAFEPWCWRRLLRVPWTTRWSNQSILKEISPGISLEGMMLKLKLQYFCHLMRRIDSLEKTLMLGGLVGQEEKGTTEDEMAGWHHWLDGWEMSELRELVMDREAWRTVIHGVAKSRTRLSDWSDLIWYFFNFHFYNLLLCKKKKNNLFFKANFIHIYIFNNFCDFLFSFFFLPFFNIVFLKIQPLL